MGKGIFKGKTMLMLGSNAGSVDMVQYAKNNGAYTIVADYLPSEESEAKKFSDENVLISTANTEALKRLIEDRHVDGIVSGISEFNLLNAMSLSEFYGKRFYCNREQWDSIEHKDKFRNLCVEYGVPCPKTYYVGKSIKDCEMRDLSYPLVVKPVDCSASEGVHICENDKELYRGFEDAVSCSDSGTAIIEEYVY